MAPQLCSRLKKTGQKAALVFVGSAAAGFPFPGVITYSATKSFTTYLAEGLNFELEGKVDVLSYQPGHVDTNINSKE
jgi:short-subunit dehydrogenase